MTLLYGLVSRGNSVLAEYTSTTGNFPQVTRMILKNIPSDKPKGIYAADGHVFSYFIHESLTYMCMSEAGDTRQSINFAFLKDIQEKFVSTYGQLGKTAIAFAMNEEFSRVIRKQMDYFNSGQGDKIGSIAKQLDATKDIMIENIDKILERGEKIELLVDKTDKLSEQAYKFEKSSRQLKHTMYWQNFKMYALIGFVVAVVIFFIAASACGGLSFSGCRSS